MTKSPTVRTESSWRRRTTSSFKVLILKVRTITFATDGATFIKDALFERDEEAGSEQTRENASNSR